ncbi:MAG: class I SAM-dependent methyltransferase, partial [Elusimicrobiales bacterium]|nr:class I SAM-dependent methyltransferase [Elusimicrobiales bacterium]
MSKIKDFFDNHAKVWNSYHKQCDFDAADLAMRKISVNRNDIILDVGTGTGILIPFIQKYQCLNITAIDLSSEMIKIVQAKFPSIKTVCADYENESLFQTKSFTKIIIYNTFPHFPHPEKIIKNAFCQLKKTGILMIAHSMNRDKLDLKHKKIGGIVGNHMLISDKDIKAAFLKAGFMDIKIENKTYFFAFGKK